MIPMHPVDFANRKREPATGGVANQQPPEFYFSGLSQSQQGLERDTQQQFSANIHEPAKNSAAMMRQRPKLAPLSHLLKHTGRQSQPFRPDAEDHYGFRSHGDYVLLRGNMRGPFAEIILGDFPVQQPGKRSVVLRR
jgi:hypothetical protein